MNVSTVHTGVCSFFLLIYGKFLVFKNLYYLDHLVALINIWCDNKALLRITLTTASDVEVKITDVEFGHLRQSFILR